MNFSLTTEYSSLFIFLCIACGLVYAFTLYYKEKSVKNIGSSLVFLLAALRFILVSFLCFLLLSPLIKSSTQKVEKPIVAIVQDNSKSVVLNKDSSFYRTTYLNSLNNLCEQLSEKYEIKRYTTGNALLKDGVINYTDKQTGLSDFFEEAQTMFANVNVGAVVLASDGIYNKGGNPLYSLKSLKVPVYTVALGDTAVKKDMAIAKIAHNKLAYLGNVFPVEVLINAKLLSGENAELAIFKGAEKVFATTYTITGSSFSATIPLQLEAKSIGVQRYRAVITQLNNESSYTNNQADFFVEVLDSRQKVLLVYDAPHPDITAIKSAIDANQNYETTLSDLNSYASLGKYNLVIYHTVEGASGKVEVERFLKDLSAASVPVLLVGNPALFTGINTGVKLTKPTNKYNEVEPVLNKNFALFTISEELKLYAKNLPALTCPFGTYEVANGFNGLFYQKIGNVETTQPAIGFFEVGEQKVGIVAGEGLWRWKLREYADKSNNNLFNELVQKMVQYLSAKEDKSFFRVQAPKTIFENEPLEIQAEVYNNSYELVNDADVTLTIKDEQGNKYVSTFSKYGKSYSLNAGYFPVGRYSYDAEALINGVKQKVSGVVIINPVWVENTNTTADHQLLFNISSKTGGSMYYPAQLNKLQEELLSNKEIKSIIHTETKLDELINAKWIFFFLLALLSLEWFIRKYSGSY